jgi:hypothetical protein
MTKTNTTLERRLWVLTSATGYGNAPYSSPRPFGREWSGTESGRDEIQDVASRLLRIIVVGV